MTEISYHKITRAHLPYRMKWLNDPKVNRYLGTRVQKGTDEEFHRAWFDKYEDDETREIFMIELDGKIIGQVGLLDISLLDKNADLYIIIGEDEYRGHGYAQEAMKFITDYAFDKLKLHKIGLAVNELNEAAIKAYHKFGFVEEARLKDQFANNASYVDEINMAIFNPNK